MREPFRSDRGGGGGSFRGGGGGYGGPGGDYRDEGPPEEVTAKKAKINAIWEQLNSKTASVSSEPRRVSVTPSSGGAAAKVANVTPGWMKNLGMAPKNESKSSSAENSAKFHIVTTASEENKVDVGGQQTGKGETSKEEEGRNVASAALAAVKATTKVITHGKIEISEIRDFAGEEVQVVKFVELNSEEALVVKRKAEMQTGSLSGLDSLLEKIGKKPKLNILDKSRKDWGEFKEEKGIVSELESHIKSGDKYTDKVAFLQRTDRREYEKERDARLAALSKRRLNSDPLD